VADDNYPFLLQLLKDAAQGGPGRAQLHGPALDRGQLCAWLKARYGIADKRYAVCVIERRVTARHHGELAHAPYGDLGYWPVERTSKVHVRLAVEGGWPPVAFEELEASFLGDHRYELLSPPAFAKRLAVGDIVGVAHYGSPELPWVDSMIEPSGHSTVRVIFFRVAGQEPEDNLRHELDRLGAKVYGTAFRGMIAVDIPGEVNYDSVRVILREGELRKLWEFDEGAISYLHDYDPDDYGH
jgi:hypothetical protein